jgi:Uma2 family endonuclease
MASKSMVPVEEYLRMKFDRPDPEYLDGELVQRHLEDTSHSATQKRLLFALQVSERQAGVVSFPEIHLRTSLSRYRIADLAIFLDAPTQRGVRHVWLVDPSSRTFSVYDDNGMRDVARLELPELNFELTPEQVFG